MSPLAQCVGGSQLAHFTDRVDANCVQMVESWSILPFAHSLGRVCSTQGRERVTMKLCMSAIFLTALGKCVSVCQAMLRGENRASYLFIFTKHVVIVYGVAVWVSSFTTTFAENEPSICLSAITCLPNGNTTESACDRRSSQCPPCLSWTRTWWRAFPTLFKRNANVGRKWELLRRRGLFWY